tara:strand:- start:283 stop:468 length:186 start_codon:yes stop_codon:yes gene_type:complete
MEIKNRHEVLEFIKEYPAAPIRTALTMRDGYVTLIKPIPTICGAEMMCSNATRVFLERVAD